jgi:hypothetical protein
MAPRLMWWSPVRYLLPVFVGVELALLLDRGQPWRGEWAWTVDWVGSNVVLLGPIVAGVAAWRVVTVSSGLGEAAEVMSPSGVAPLVELVGVIGWAWLSHCLCVAAALLLTFSLHPAGFPGLLPLLPQFVHIAAYAALGAILGTVVPNPLMAPLTAISLLVAVTQFSAGRFPSLWVYVGGATTSLVGLRYNPQVVLAQLVMGVCLFLLAFAVRRSRASGLRLVKPLALASGIPLVAASSWLSGGPQQYVPVATMPAWACDGDAPTVCVHQANAWAKEPIERVLHALTAAARDEGAHQLPERFQQLSPGGEVDPTARAFVINPGSVSHGAADPLQFVHYFVLDTRCLTADASPPGIAIARLQLVSEYLVVKAGLAAEATLADPALDALMSADPRGRAAWIVEALDASRRCQFSAVPPPPSGAA